MATGAVKRFGDERESGFVRRSGVVGDGHRSLREGAYVDRDAQAGNRGPRPSNIQGS